MYHKSINYGPVEKFLRANPDGTHKQFLLAHKGFKISDAAFYTFRKKLKKGKGRSKAGEVISSEEILGMFKPRGRSHAAYRKAIEFLRNDPNATYEPYRKAVSGKKVNDCTFYRIKTKIKSGKVVLATANITVASRKRKNVYMRVFSTPSESIPLIAKKLLKDFVECLNGSKRTKMEVVEYNDPKEIEVREVR